MGSPSDSTRSCDDSFSSRSRRRGRRRSGSTNGFAIATRSDSSTSSASPRSPGGWTRRGWRSSSATSKGRPTTSSTPPARRLVKLIGDEVMFVATDPADACRAASGLMAGFGDEAERVVPRGGLAYGDVLVRGGDYYGSIVNLAVPARRRSRAAGVAGDRGGGAGRGRLRVRTRRPAHGQGLRRPDHGAVLRRRLISARLRGRGSRCGLPSGRPWRDGTPPGPSRLGRTPTTPTARSTRRSSRPLR